jgi:sec-independent protein translocase protein TatB
MFDITSSKLLILAVVALLVVGPKDLPLLLRTVGKYLGIIRRHANEFRSQLDEAIREAELQDLRKEFESVGQEMKATMEEGARAIDSNVAAARSGIDGALKAPVEAAGESARLPDVPDEQPLPGKTGT